MAHRAIASSGQKETETAAFASLTAADIIRAPIVQRRIPVDFRPLLKPFKSAGRLCLRIERLPQGAKLSAGRRSTDNSWSLASDELEDLDYLVSSNVSLDHELTVRVMTFEDGAASTLKVMQFVVPAGDAAPVQAGRDPHAQDAVTRSQLSEMHSLFAVRESELVELRAALQRAASEKEGALEKARGEWELELDRKIAEAVAQSRVQDGLDGKGTAGRQQVKGEIDQQLEIERRKWQVETERLVKVARQEWKTEADRTMEAQRLSWEAQSDERRRVEIEKLKAENEKRVEAERQNFQAQADDRVARESESSKAEGRERTDAERKKWLAQAEEKAAKERKLWHADAQRQIEEARQGWWAEAEELRIAEIEKLKADADQRIEEERRKWLAEGSENDRAEFERSKAEIESRIRSERENWQIEADEQAKKDRERWQADADAQLANEQARLKAEAERRIEAERRACQADADAQFASQQARLQAEAEQRIEAARRACQADAEAQLTAEQTRLKAEAELSAEAERRRFEIEIQAAVKAAAENSTATVTRSEVDHEASQELVEEKDKNRQLNAALAAEADKCREIESALAAMTLRCENAERSQATGESRAPEADDGYIRGLRAEIATLRKSMANQAAELGRARASLEQSRPMHIQRGPENKPLGNLRDVFQDDEKEVSQEKKKGLVRDCFLVAAVVIPIILFYPWIAAYLPQPVRNGIGVATGGLLAVEEEKPVAPQAPPKKPAPAPQVSRPTAIASRVLNVHASAGSKGEVLFSLPKSTVVVLLETQGNWTRIEAPADGAEKTRQGWVYSAYLHDNDN